MADVIVQRLYKLVNVNILFCIDRGFLTLEDFKRAFSQVAPKLPARTVLEVFRYRHRIRPS